MIWFQDPGGHRRIDGDHLAYLHPSTDVGDELRSLDPELYDRLWLMAAQAGRPLSIRETCRELPKDSLRFDQPLTFDDLAQDDAAARAVWRQRWFHKAMVAVSQCSLVFLDSDDSMAGDDTPHASSGLADAGISMAEVAQFLARGQSVVTHQLAEPSQAQPNSITARLNDVHKAVGAEPTLLVSKAGDCTRLFAVIPHDRHRSTMNDRISALQLPSRRSAFRVYRWHPTLVRA